MTSHDGRRWVTSREIAERDGRSQRSVQVWLAAFEAQHGPVRRSKRGPVDLHKIRQFDPAFMLSLGLGDAADEMTQRLDRQGASLTDLRARVRELEKFRALALEWFERGAK